MTSRLSEAVSEKIGHAEGLYHQLVLVVGAECQGKTAALEEVAERIAAPLVNVNLALSRLLLNVAEQQRPRHVQRLLGQIVERIGSEVVLLDNIELLFDAALQQDPLRLLQGLSRHRIVVAAWNGSIEDGCIRYAATGHPEYRHYAMDGILVVNAGTAA